MNRQTFASGRSKNKLRQEERWLESLCILGLLLAALVLFCINLGNLPLRDWDEGTVARVAKEIWLSPGDFNSWLFPTFWGEAYLNKPPLVHGLIALFYSIGGVNELSARLPGALLSAFSVLLLYGIGREIFVARVPALFSALIYLTLLPVVRHGRLAMLDGAVLCFSLLMFLSVLRSRRDLRWTLGAGISFGLICLSKGIVGLLLGAIALIFLAWDTPRLLHSIYLWSGIFLGSVPVVAWYLAQYIHYQNLFVNTALMEQSLGRIWSSVDGHAGAPWYYLFELVKYPWPWILFSVYGLKLAWDNRNWGWAKLVLVWSGVYFLVVSLMLTKLPWYILPIYPALALAGGAKLAQICNLPQKDSLPRSWSIFLGLLALFAAIACVYFAITQTRDWTLAIIFGSLTLTMGVAAILLKRKDRQFIQILFWGTYISLFLFVSSPYWIWELNEAYPVKVVAEGIKGNVPANEVVYTSFDYARPSLDFYSDRQIFPAKTDELRQHWQSSPRPYLLLDAATFKQLSLPKTKILVTAEIEPNDWLLITKDNE